MKEPATHKAITRLLLHLHPQRIDTRAIKFNRTFGLGGIAALLMVLLFVTGKKWLRNARASITTSP
ncbi:hypothetical protein [Geofilum rubicundum]|uniref:Uncharacterized protein n=1 Tax=Geofilum rubicundum JCM 15548 TaxID=1236989 RepID=A0A0E9LWN4_9BACT|nr:hypothetical protein [Geofilum rubicundum]GAO29664.1 hypothetical protein JCM15548_11876 [Geofilum rubicundum JCM 15548]